MQPQALFINIDGDKMWKIHAEELYPNGDSRILGFLSRNFNELTGDTKRDFSYNTFEYEYYNDIHDVHKALLAIQSKNSTLRLDVMECK